MFSTSFNEHIAGKESILDARETDTDIFSDTFTMFVMAMVITSIWVTPVIIGTTQAAMMWRQLKKG